MQETQVRSLGWADPLENRGRRRLQPPDGAELAWALSAQPTRNERGSCWVWLVVPVSLPPGPR